MRKKRSFLFVLLSLAPLLLCSPAVVLSQQRWERTYGGTGRDLGNSVQQTSDGGYIVAGSTSSFGNLDQVYLIKTNASGDTLWTRTYGGTDVDAGWSVQQTSDGGYIAAGYNLGAGLKVYLIKTNVSGDTLWSRTYGGTQGNEGYSVQQTTDGGYIVAGREDFIGRWSDVYLIKTNAFGDTIWSRTYGGTGIDWGYSVQQTTDGGYIVAGYTNSYGAGQTDVWLIKTNASGVPLWTRTYGTAGMEKAWSVRQTSDGGYIIAGYTDSSFPNGDQVYLIKANASGDTTWSRTYGGTGHEYGYSVQQTTDGGFIVAGETRSFGNSTQVYLFKTNAGGDTLWTRTFGGDSIDYGNSVQQTLDGGYVVAGYTNSFGDSSQVYLIKTDSLGRSTGVEETAGVRGQGLGVRITARPNPFTSLSQVPGHEAERFALYDIAGRKVGTYQGDRIGEGLGAGVYFLTPEGGKAKPVRIVKLR